MTAPILGEANGVDVSVVIVNYNTAHLLPEMWQCLEAASAGLKVESIFIDNASRDDSAKVIPRDYPQAHFIANSTNVGFGRANNQALPYAHGRYVLLLNTDAFVQPDTLKKTVAYLDAHPDVGVLGVKLVGRDGEMQPCCRYFPTPLNTFVAQAGLQRYAPGLRMVDDFAWDHAAVRECDWVTGCYFLIRREVVAQLGLFDPRFFLYCEEVDLCRRVKTAGWKVVFFPHTQVVHVGGESAKSDAELTSGRQISVLQVESESLYFRKHFGWAGALLALCLGTIADLIQMLRSVLKRRPLTVNAAHLKSLWRLAWLTRLGQRPTR